MHRTVTVFVYLIAAATLASASTIAFVGAPTGVNDGHYYVTPYEISIDGVDQLVTCYDSLDDVNVGDSWHANLLDLADAASSGFFTSNNALAGYERIAWLSAQMYTDSAEEIGLQYAIWNVFGGSSAPGDTPDSLTYENAANAAAAVNYGTFDFSPFLFIQAPGAIAGTSGTEQAFVFETTSSGLGQTNQDTVAPEPGTILTILTGLSLVALAGLRRARR